MRQEPTQISAIVLRQAVALIDPEVGGSVA